MATVSQSEACSTSFESSVARDLVTATKVQGCEPDSGAADEQTTPLKQKRRRRRSLSFVGSSSEEEVDLPRTVRRKCSVNYYESDSCSEDEAVLEHSPPVEGGWHSKVSNSKPSLPEGVIRGCEHCSSCQKVVARWRPGAGHHFSLPEAPCFYPTEEEFKDTLKYIASIRSEAEQYGVVRIMPPPSWRPPCPLKDPHSDVQNLVFPTRVQKIHQLQSRDPVLKKPAPAATKQVNVRKKRKSKYGSVGRCRKNTQTSPMGRMKGQIVGTVDHSEFFGFEPGASFKMKDFEAYANDFKAQYFERQEANPNPSNQCTGRWDPPLETIEGEYWRIVENATEQIEVLYGADVETASYCSGFSKQERGAGSVDSDPYVTSGWNLNNIARSPGSILAFEEGNISGVQVPWLYVGMCFSSFCWHVEDHHFYSLNYMHYGEPKIWYGVPGNAAQKLEEVMKKRLPDLFAEQPDLLHKLVTQLSPAILREEGVPVFKVKQRPGEFVITLPRAYHSGFNCGFNCAEAVNVAPVDWLPHGQSAVELYKRQLRKTSVSHDKLLIAAAWHAVKTQWGAAAKPDDSTKCCPNPWKESCGPTSLLAKALKARVELERKRQGSLKGEILFKQMDQTFDATDERECFYCRYDLHLSAVGCACSPEKYACLEHTLQLCSCSWGNKFVLCRVDLASLEILLAAVEGKPNYVMAVIKWQKMQEENRFKVSLESQVNAIRPSDQYVAPVLEKGPSLSTWNGPLSTESRNEGSNVYGGQGNRDQAPGGWGSVKIEVFSLSSEVADCRHSSVQVSTAGSQLVGAGKAAPLQECQSSVVSSSQLCSWMGKPVGPDRSVRLSKDQSSLYILPGTSGSDASIAQYGVKSVLPAEHWSQQDAERLTTNTNLKPDQFLGRPSNPHQTFEAPRVDRQGGPRVAKVVRTRKCLPDAELLNVGTLVLEPGYHDKNIILPAGFKSRRQFHSLLNPSELSYYESEILEGIGGPIFKVILAGQNGESFISRNIDHCWQQVQEKLNAVIMQQRGRGRINLPPLQPSEILHGVAMFGLTSPDIIKAVETLDPYHQCSEYWKERVRRLETQKRPSSNGVGGIFCDSPDKVGSAAFLKPVNTTSALDSVHSEVGEPSAASIAGLKKISVLSLGGVQLQRDLEVLRGFFRKAVSGELQALYRLMERAKEGGDWNSVQQALVEELDFRSR